MKKLFLLFSGFLAVIHFCNAQHNAGHNGKILMIASNPSVSKQTGWPIGVWYAELAHPYWVFTDAGYTVDIVSPEEFAWAYHAIKELTIMKKWEEGSHLNSLNVSSSGICGLPLHRRYLPTPGVY